MKFLLIISFLIPTKIWSQSNIHTKHYTPNDGLASSETYTLQTDAQGYLWIGTDRGLNKFDGKNFITYTTAQGLGTNFVDKIFINPYNQQIWVRCLNKKLYFFENEYFKPYKYNEVLSKYLSTYLDEIQNVSFINNDLDKIYTKCNGVLLQTDKNLINVDNKSTQSINVFVDKNTNTPYADVNFRSFINNRKSTNTSTSFYNNVIDLNGDGKVQCLFRHNGNILVAVNKYLYEIKNDSIIKQRFFEKCIIYMYEDKNNRLWISENSATGIHRFNANEFPNKDNGTIFFTNYAVTSIIEDQENDFWVSTHDDGIFFVPDMSVTEINIPVNVAEKEIASKIECSNKGVLFAGTNKQKIFWKQNNIWRNITCLNYILKYKKFSAPTKNSTICNSLFFDNTLNKLFYAIPNTGCINFSNLSQEPQSYGNAFDIKKIDTKIVATDLFGLLIYDYGKPSKVKRILNNERNYSSVYFNNKIWIGAESGLYNLKYENKIVDDSLYKFNGFTKTTRVTTLKVINNNTLVAATLGEGIYFTNGTNGKFLSLNDPVFVSQNGYNMVNDIEVNKDTVFAATQNGVVWFNALQDKPLLHYISNKSGITLNDVKSITYNNNHLYILNQNKIIDINFETYNKSIYNIPIFITKAIINDSVLLNLKNKIKLPSNQDKLKIFFSALSFKTGNQIFYQYRLLNSQNKNDSAWQITQNTFIEYASLKAGNYTFQARAINENNLPSTIIQQFNFVIDEPFYLTGWFILCLILFSLFLMLLINHLRLKRIEKQNNQQEQLLKYEQQALAAQINPHFIFNSLNSIQSFILKKDERQTLKYITQFSRLMRLSLDNSRAKWVVPKAELDLIKVYLELEKLRFGEKFDYVIDIDPKLNTEKFLIAPMLAQPFIENAIKHGVNNLTNKKGLITVRAILKLPQKKVLIQIEDNGIGRINAKINDSELTKNHLSAGVDITINRIRLLCYEAKNEFYFNIIDKPNHSGTIIEFYLPHKVNPDN